MLFETNSEDAANQVGTAVLTLEMELLFKRSNKKRLLMLLMYGNAECDDGQGFNLIEGLSQPLVGIPAVSECFLEHYSMSQKGGSVNKNVHGIANELIKHHPEGIHNTTNSVTVVAVFFAAVAFAAIFTVRGGDSNDGKTVVVHKSSFKIFNFNGGPHCRASDAQPIHLRNLNGL
ncbi:hypothetical protein Tco_0411427 [Tanacetum coccineum]